MTAKRIAHDDLGVVLRTTNGVDTKTHTVYLKELKSYDTRLPNGFNAELADDLVAILFAFPALHDQGSWRRLMANSYDLAEYAGELEDTGDGDLETLRDQIAAQAAFKYEETIPTCGTAMCAAGWIGELTGADWVVDAADLTKAYTTGHGSFETELADELNQLSDTVLVAKDSPIPMSTYWDHISEELSEALERRGFSDQTHKMVAVCDYAADQLGLGHSGSSSEPMFSGSNRLEDIIGYIERYKSSKTALR